jgi:hypothetical protein
MIFITPKRAAVADWTVVGSCLPRIFAPLPQELIGRPKVPQLRMEMLSD